MMKNFSLLKKFSSALVAGLTLSALWLSLGNSGTISWLPPLFIFSLVGITLFASLIFPFIWHFRLNKQTDNSDKILGILNVIIRYSIAFNLCRFGWAKIFGLQFIVPETIATQPINQLSGEWLTWFYFGYSHAFGTILALIQIVGSYFLLFRKTLLISAISLFAFMLNLTLINIFYQMNAGALTESVLLTIGLVYLILSDYQRLKIFFLKTLPNIPMLTIKNSTTKNLLRLSTVLLSLLYTLYLVSSMH
ncbi:MAG: hypothetical protein QM763_13040 [Agriterribacter sp.]